MSEKINHISQFTPAGVIEPETVWKIHYPQTNEFWAGDTSVQIAEGYYGWSGKVSAHDFYGSSGAARLNVINQDTTTNVGGDKPIQVSFTFSTSGNDSILFSTTNPIYPYGVPGTITINPITYKYNIKVYSDQDIKELDTTWEALKIREPSAVHEILESSTGDSIIGIEPANTWPSGVWLLVTYKIAVKSSN